MTYDEALAALRRALAFGIHSSLDGIRELTDALGRPQDTFSVVQVAGTNGKGSTARLTAAILAAHGRTVGLYTSPELERVNERIEVDGAPVEDDAFARALSAALGAAETTRPRAQGTDAGHTEFELLTAAALWHFRECGVDTAVLEVGLGGRWDATSVAHPHVAVVTGVGLDHTAILGDTLEAIAAEKAAIIAPAAAPVLGPGTAVVEQVFLDRAEAVDTHARAVREVGAPTPVTPELTVRYQLTATPDSPGAATCVDVTGVHAAYPGLCLRAPAYQAANVATAVAAAEAARGRALDAAATRDAIAGATLPGRFELVASNPPLIVDGSHNPQAAGVLAAAIEQAWPDSSARPIAVLGVLADKDAAGIVEALMPVVAGFVITQPDSPRARSVADLAGIVELVTGRVPVAEPSLVRAVATARETSPHGVVVTGSITTAGQARSALRDELETKGI